MPSSTRWSWKCCVDTWVRYSIPAAAGLGASPGQGWPLAVQRNRPVPRRFVISVEGSCPCQLISFVARGPNMASGSVWFRNRAVASITAVAPAMTSGSRSISGAPENEAVATNMSGWRAAYVVDPNPP